MFLDVLAETMDDHEISAEDLAGRVHLSRFHFDRLVTAAGGEPPATLRRRVLLERAAYRLVTTGEGIIRVAMDAGYGSHEAFTRAFTRAYGQPPSLWRRHPTGLTLDAPSCVHFHPPGGLRLSAHRKATGMDLMTRLVEHHIWLIGEMLTRAERLTDEQLEAPIELSVEGIDDNPTLRSLLARLVGQMAMWNASTDNRPYDFESERGETLAEMRAKLAVAGPAFLTQVRTVSDEGRMDDTFVDATCEPPEVFTYGGMIAHVLTFAAHRRVLVCGAFYDLGITDLGDGDPMRWMAESAS